MGAGASAGASALETNAMVSNELAKTSEGDLRNKMLALPAETRDKLREAIRKAEKAGSTDLNQATPDAAAATEEVTTEEMVEAIDMVISMGMSMDREVKANDADEAAPGELGRLAQRRNPRLRRKSRDLYEKVRACLLKRRPHSARVLTFHSMWSQSTRELT